MKAAFLLLLLLTATGVAQDPERAFYRGNDAFEKKDYAAAITAYEEAIGLGARGATIHFNLGNACLFAGRHGAALYHYRVAERFEPRDPDIAANLRAARARAAEKFTRPTTTAFVAWLLFAHRKLTQREAFAWMTGCVLAAAAFFAAHVLWRQPLVKKLGLIAVLPAFALAVSLVLRSQRIGESLEGVVIAPEAQVFTGPSETAYQVYFKLHEGAEVTVEERTPDWIKIVAGDRKGYIPASHLALL